MGPLLRGLVPICLILGQAPLAAQQASCPPPGAAAGTGTVIGRILEVRTGAPLAAAQVELRAPSLDEPLRGRSGLDGRVLFCSAPAGEVVMSATLDGRRGAVGPAVLEPGGTLDLVIELWSAAEDAGTLAGEVVDAESGKPVEGAHVVLAEVGLSAISNDLGRFVFPSVRPDLLTLEVRRLGYAETQGTVRIEGGKATETRVSLAVEAVSLEPITVTAVRRRVRLPDLEDFERRYYSGWGRFVLEDEIRLRNPTKVTQVLSDTGVQLTANGTELTMRRTGCAPMVYVDDVKLTYLPRGGREDPRRLAPPNRGNYPWPIPEASPAVEAADAVNLIHPSEVLAVEIYRGPAETPGQYIDSNSQCGVILIWTRRGGEVRKRQ